MYGNLISEVIVLVTVGALPLPRLTVLINVDVIVLGAAVVVLATVRQLHFRELF
jgi:hypothetical protein